MRSIPELGPRERRVLGVLLEKEQTTPEYYPLTLKAVVAACNQKSNRDPVVELEEADVHNVLRVLVQEGWVRRVAGARVDRWEHCLEDQFDASDDCKALITLLLLRGPQTPGELRSRSERLYTFDSLSEVGETLLDLAEADPLLVVELARGAGEKQSRWTLAGDESAELASPTSVRSDFGPPGSAQAGSTTASQESSLQRRLAGLEEQVQELSSRLARLESLLE
ncbi:MAG TPA: YceH family protein [Acidobacteriota bacterium]|nr:YceH family protein [Acidobacteriota bacterium]